MSHNDAIRDATHAYIARHSCGAVVGVTVDTGDSDTAKFVAHCIRRGQTIERVTIPEARAVEFCKCFNRKRTPNFTKQESLL